MIIKKRTRMVINLKLILIKLIFSIVFFVIKTTFLIRNNNNKFDRIEVRNESIETQLFKNNLVIVFVFVCIIMFCTNL